MTAAEIYDLVTHGGGNDFSAVIGVCESVGDYCLIGGLAVNCYVEPVYTVDADVVVVASEMPRLRELLQKAGFESETFEPSLNARLGGSDLRIQFTTDARYQKFPGRARRQEVLGVSALVACVEDVAQGKLWAWSDPKRRLSKRKKDELDLIRLAENYPELKSIYPPELLAMLTE